MRMRSAPLRVCAASNPVGLKRAGVTARLRNTMLAPLPPGPLSVAVLPL